MLSIGGAISSARETMHGTRSAKLFYKLLGWPYLIHRTSPDYTVLFLGDSITQLWAVENGSLFASNGFINAGVGGQTSGQIRRSCRRDIIRTGPDAVHLICGINDIAENLGPVSNRFILSNLESVVRYCRTREIAIMVGSITPVTTVPWRPDMRPQKKIDEINIGLRQLCLKWNIEYIDYFPILKNEVEELQKDYTIDGLHLSRAGYDAIEPVLLQTVGRVKRCLPVKTRRSDDMSAI